MLQRAWRKLVGPNTAAASTNDESQPGPERERSPPPPSPPPPRTTAPGAPPPVLTNATGTASAPAHPLFDIKRVDTNLLSEWLNEWVGASPLPPFETIYCHAYHQEMLASEKSVISFMLIDTRVFLALYHRYYVRRKLTLAMILTNWHRRIVDLSPYDGGLEQAVDRSQRNWSFIPRFNLVESDLNGWLQDAPTSLLLSRIADRRLILSSFDCDHELPCTSITVKGVPVHLLHRLAQDDRPVRLPTPASPDHPSAPVAARLVAQPVRQDPTARSRFVARFALFLGRVPNLTLWDLEGRFGSSSLAFVRALPPLPQLKGLNLDKNRIPSAAEASELATTLRRFPNLSSLNLARNFAGVDANDCVAILSSSLEFLPQLTWLSLAYNDIGDEGCRALARALHHVPHLRWLYLQRNHIREAGCRALAASFRHVPRLRVLWLSQNEMGDEGCCAMAEEMHYLSCLEVLNINWNNVTCVGYSAMILALEHHAMMFHVSEGNNTSGPKPPLPRFVRVANMWFR